MLATELRPLDLTMPDGVCDAVFAAPAEGGPYPSMLFLMDAIGLRPAIEAMVERLAAQGYVVLAPNLFYRDGRSPVVPVPDLMAAENRDRFFERLMPIMRAFTPERVVADASVYLDALQGMPKAKAGPVGVTGYCLGGGAAIRIAAAFPGRVASVASFHGGNLATEAENSPHRLVDRIKGEVYVGHADHDGSAPPEQQARLEEALTQAGVPHRTELYEGAAHGFTMADTAAYDEASAERHWARMLDLFRRTLGVDSP